MCGLVFAASKWSLIASDVDIFKKMLIADQFRGEHSTGVFSLYRPYGKDHYFEVTKEATSGSVFAESISFKKATNGLRHASQVGKTITGIDSPRVLFGHNRYATVGAVNEKNAHPFHHEHIVLAHNGTLRDQSLLPDHKRFEVDSENIAYSIAKIGIDETVKKLNGAFALIWYNDQEKTINFLRNKEREFHLFEMDNGDWFGCSEEKMGEWILTRGKSPKKIKNHFELEPGTQYVFDVSDGIKLKEERKHELPTFPTYVYSRSAWYDYYESDYDLHRSYPERKPQTPPQRNSSVIPLPVNALLQKYGIEERVGDWVSFETYQFKPYKTSTLGNGEIIGWLPENEEYIELQIGNIHERYFQMDQIATVQIVSAFEQNKSLVIICRIDDATKLYAASSNIVNFPVVVSPPATIEVEPEEVEDEDEPEVKETSTGEKFTEEQWRKSEHNVCCYCSNPIPFHEVPDVDIHDSYSFCGVCAEGQVIEEEDEDDIPFDIMKDLEEKIEPVGEYCKACNTHHGEDVINGNITHEEYKKLDPLCKYYINLSHQFRTVTLGNLVKKPSGWCDICGVIHSDEILKGDFTLAYWNALPVSCSVKLKFKEKFTKENRPTLCYDKETKSFTAVHKVTRRPIDIFYSVPCPVCTVTHSKPIVGGEVDKTTYTNMIEGCPVKDYWMKEYNLI